MIDALVALYEATFDGRWIAAAQELARIMIDQFWDDAEGGFFFTGKDHETLIARTKDPHDNATPSGNSMAVTALLRLYKLHGQRRLAQESDQDAGVVSRLAGLDAPGGRADADCARLLPRARAGVRGGGGRPCALKRPCVS